LIEPSRPGISYSFTYDGFYEEAYYRAISNPSDPSCPGGIMQWQHGSYVIGSDGSLTMTPIAVDGRQLLSTPCSSTHALYTRYNTTEKMKVSLSKPLSSRTTVLTKTKGIPRLHRPLPRHPPHRPYRIRRQNHATNVPRLLSSPNAAHRNPQPHSRCHQHSHFQSKARRRGPHEFQDGCSESGHEP
jgi:hypothetical protein